MDKTYARLDGNKAVEIITLAAGLTLAECFHKDVAALFSECPTGTLVGATVDGDAWTAPPAPPEPSSPGYASLHPLAFYLAFTPAERIAIKSSTDATVKEFWETYELAAQFGIAIDPNLPSVQEGLTYLRTAGILASDERAAQISAGTPQ